MARIIQEQKEEEIVVCKSRPAAMSISSFIATSSSTASSPIASTSPGMPIVSGQHGSRMSSNSFDAASTSQVRLKGAFFGGLWESSGETCRIKEKKIQKIPIMELGAKLVAHNSKAWEQPLHKEPVL